MSSYTAQHLTALREAMASGAQIVEFDGRKTTFRSLAEMQALETRILADLGQTVPQTRRIQVLTSKGV